MTIAEEITEPRYKFAQSKGLEMWREFTDKIPPTKLNDIVRATGISVKEADLEIDGIVRMDSSGICFILCKRNISTVRKRFTIAHEFGHIALEHITFDKDSSQISSSSQEKEANQFAGSLLVPKEDLRVFLSNKDKKIEDIMKRYWVSKDVALIAVTSNRLFNKLQ